MLVKKRFAPLFNFAAVSSKRMMDMERKHALIVSLRPHFSAGRKHSQNAHSIDDKSIYRRSVFTITMVLSTGTLSLGGCQ